MWHHDPGRESPRGKRIMTFFPRSFDSVTSPPWKTGTVKSGMADPTVTGRGAGAWAPAGAAADTTRSSERSAAESVGHRTTRRMAYSFGLGCGQAEE
jgi:hypothetical protein